MLITLIKELYKKGIDVVLFNYRDGIIATELHKAHVPVNIIDIGTLNFGEINILVKETDVFIIFSFLEIYHHFLKVNPRLVYYNIDDFLCDAAKYKFGVNPAANNKKLIEILTQKNGLALMDDTGIRSAVKRLNFTITNPFFLPIPVAVPPQNNYLLTFRDIPGVLKISYIGRSVDWKIFPLKKILDDIVSVNGMGKKIIFSIVTDSIEALKKLLDVKKYEQHDFIKINLVEKLLPSEIKTFLLQNADLNFGMGTTALESAQSGIPTILMDYSSAEFLKAYRYKWLYQTACFSLGKNLRDTPVDHDSGITMQQLLCNVSRDKDYLRLQSANNFKYVAQYHSVDKIANRLIAISSRTTFRFKDAKKYILYYSRFHRFLKKFIRN